MLFEPRGVKNKYSTPVSTGEGVTTKSDLSVLVAVGSPENGDLGREEVAKIHPTNVQIS